MQKPRTIQAAASLPTGQLEPGRITRGQWLALIAALLGWMFDGAEMGVFSLVGRSSLADLLKRDLTGAVTDQQIGLWFNVVTASFLVGAATGGVLFGWLGDRVGRVRAMTLSVLTYALFTGLCGMAQSAAQMGALRFVAALGMGGEWSLGVALVMEVWPNRSRAFMAGLIGAAANVGYMLVGFVGLGLATVLADVQLWLERLRVPQPTVDMLVRNQGWRILMLLGVAPALLTFLIRLFVPESKRWQHQQELGGTSNWATRDLLGVLVGALGPALMIYLWAEPHAIGVRLAGSIVGLLVALCGYTYPVVRYLQRQDLASDGSREIAWQPTLRRMLLGAGLSGVALLGTWGATQQAPSWADKIGSAALHPREWTQIFSAFGAVLGTLIAAKLGDLLGRRVTYCLLCLVSIASLVWLFQGQSEYGNQFLVAAFLVGACTASFYGWLPLYLPELFRTSVRATGQGFGFNFGRILAAVGVLQASNLFAGEIQVGGRTFAGGYPFVCTAMSLIYVAGLVLIWFAPETRGRELPE